MKMAIDKSFFIQNRERLINRLPEGTAVFLFAGTKRPISRDSDSRFLPDRNFYYMTGLDYPEGKLIMTHDQTMLFAPVRDEMIERWRGKRKDFEELAAISGIAVEDIYPLGDFDEKKYAVLKDHAANTAVDGTSIGEDTKAFRASLDVETDIGDVLTAMRMVKSEEEIESIREAAKITEAAVKEMKEKIAEGATEIDLYTVLEYGMSRRGSLIPAFETIVSIGNNTFYLHHGDPEGDDGEKVTDGCQIQIDVGARFNGYCADISRVFFVGGRKEDDKRYELLELIRALRKKAFETIAPGETFDSLNAAVRKECGIWLASRGLIPEDFTMDDVRKYYWHNTAHHLGLDVHDVTIKERPFEKGNCLAVEPGVYIPEWNVGFRIEDDVLVTDDGCELLSSGDDDILIP